MFSVKQIIARLRLVSAIIVFGLLIGAQADAATYLVNRATPEAADTNTGEGQVFKTVHHAVNVAKPGIQSWSWRVSTMSVSR
jgi:hypothetical protein